MNENFDKLRNDENNDPGSIQQFDKLRNLIEALGQTFNLILMSDATERRVFSFAIQDDTSISEELRSILKIGVQCGYFQQSSISNKMGTGRTKLYILTRVLSPYFKLDPSSFAGYKFVTTNVLEEAMLEPRTVVGRIKTKGADNVLIDPQQLLFKDDES